MPRSIDLLHKSEKDEAFADKNPDFTDKVRHKCFAPTAKNRLLQEVALRTVAFGKARTLYCEGKRSL
jgi:hypothetical protein